MLAQAVCSGYRYIVAKVRTAKQEAILDGTLALISEHGFHGAPVSAIAKRAGVGAGTIYRYYETKDDLIKDLYLREKQILVQELMLGCSASLPVKENFSRIWHNMIQLRTRDEPRVRFLDQYYSSPYFVPVSPEERRELGAAYAELIRRGQQEGVLRPLPLPILNAMLNGPAISLANSIIAGNIEITDELLKAGFEACWHAVSNE
jgi:TetR/AcrR family transcriptional regulator, repressor of fatR-cypB operon